MSGTNDPTPTPNPTPAPAPDPANPSPGPAPTDPAALAAQLERERKDRQEANREAQNLRKRLHEIEQATKAAEDKRLAEQGEFKGLYEKLKTEREAELKELGELRGLRQSVEEKAAAERKAKEDAVASEIAALPEDLRKLIPADGSLDTKQAFLAGFRASNPSAPPAPGRTTPPAPAQNGKRVFREEELERMTFAERQALREEVRLAISEGRFITKGR